MEKQELKFGVAPAKFDIRDFKLKFNRGVAGAPVFPLEFELKMPRCKYQGQVGSCVAHSLTTIMEYFNMQESGIEHPMSVGYIYGNRRNSSWKQAGMRVRDALKNACEYGNIGEELLPEKYEVPKAIQYFEKEGAKYKEQGKPNRIKKYFKITSASAIKECIMQNGPVLIIMDWYGQNSWSYLNIVKLVNKGNRERHCMVCYGWNKDGWLIQNSWGIAWGRRGRAILPFSAKFVEVWAVIDETNISRNLKAVEPCSGAITSKFAKGINAILNFITGRK